MSYLIYVKRSIITLVPISGATYLSSMKITGKKDIE